jgi:hypothetical protein
MGDENKSGQIQELEFEHEGKKDKFIRLSDHISVRDTLKQQVDTLSTGVKELDGSKKLLSDTQTKLAATSAKVLQLEEQLKTAVNPEKISQLESQLKAANEKVTELTGKSLERYRQLVAKSHNINTETLKDKSAEQLEALDEAFKAVEASLGNRYAAGNNGANGAAGAVQSAKERIRTGFDSLHPTDK